MKYMFIIPSLSAIVSNYQFFNGSTFLDNLKVFIDLFSQLVKLLFLCDVKDTIYRKN